jgi:hypothetical protein
MEDEPLDFVAEGANAGAQAAQQDYQRGRRHDPEGGIDADDAQLFAAAEDAADQLIAAHRGVVSAADDRTFRDSFQRAYLATLLRLMCPTDAPDA